MIAGFIVIFSGVIGYAISLIIRTRQARARLENLVEKFYLSSHERSH
jgi:hypothetical protein